MRLSSLALSAHRPPTREGRAIGDDKTEEDGADPDGVDRGV
jgi:hypothetical protein